MFKKAFTFDDVALVPVYNNVSSRQTPDVTSWVTKTWQIALPIINAPMDTVISEPLADILVEKGTTPVFHRFKEHTAQLELAKKYKESAFFSVGLKDLEHVKALADFGVNKILVDIANGHCKAMLEFVETVKRDLPKMQVMAGNVCTAMGYMDLVRAGADSVRVGIGGGAACTTRMVTGVGVPQFSAIYDCAEMADKFKVPVIADGGIKSSREVCLALAAGATCVMVGKLFACTEESAAQKKDEFVGDKDNPKADGSDWIRLAKFRGQASADFQNDFYGSVRKGTVAEGVDFWSPVTGTASELIDSLVGGLRSSMTYLGAKTIKEYQTKAEFVEVTNTYSTESKPRP